jgi:hypothetical protein
MVEGKVAALYSTVLAGIPVAIEYFVAGHLALAAGPVYELGDADDGGQLDGVSNGVDVAEAVLNHLRFALVDKDDSAAGAANRKRFVALIEHQHGMVNHHQLASNMPIVLQKLSTCKAGKDDGEKS